MRILTVILAGLVLCGAVAFAQMMGQPMGQPLPSSLAGFSSGCPAAPAGAVRADFTTCIANYDWTGSTQPSVNGVNITLGAPANWLECAGATGTARQWSITNDNGAPLQPCSNVTVASDSGTQVLSLTYTPSGGYGGLNLTTGNEVPGASPANPYIITHLTAAYIEFKKRELSQNLSSCPFSFGNPYYVNCLMDDTWQWYTNGGGLEYDFMEAYSNPISFGDVVDWNAGGSHPINSSTLTTDIFNYHVYGYRITTDGATGIGVSFYVDNVFNSGGTYTPTSAAAYDDQHYLILTDGQQPASNLGEMCGNTGSATECLPYNGSIVTYYQWIHIYSCSNYAGGQCYGAILDNSP
jgi:hypothetical protein